MAMIKKLARNASRSTIGKVLDSIRLGWASYSFLFYIGGVSAILGGIFGLMGWMSTIVTILFFYYAGEFRRNVTLESKQWRTEG
jgi:hypothetical protein